MISTVKKCAIKRTVKTAGTWALGIGLGLTAFVIVATVLGFIANVIETAFPISRAIFIFAVAATFSAIFLGMPIVAAYDEYKRNVRDCEDEALMMEEDKL